MSENMPNPNDESVTESTNTASEATHPLRRAFRKALRSAAKRAERKAEKLQREMVEVDAAEELLECGEILKANLLAVKRGESEVTLPDMYHPGQTRTIALEEKLKPLDNAKKYFKRHRKRVLGAERILAELEKCLKVQATITALLDQYLTWEKTAEAKTLPPEELIVAAGELRIHVQGLDTPKVAAAKSRHPLGVRVFESKDQMTIYVGRAARDNDHLSMRVARGQEWWFHIAHQQGSHVIVRGDASALRALAEDDPKPRGRKTNHRGKPDYSLPQETLLDAAHLAVYFSKARRASRAEVHYTQAKHLRKAKKAPAGQVTLHQYQTLHLRLEESRLERLLKSGQ